MRATCLAQLILFHVIILIILDEECKLALHYAAFFSFLPLHPSLVQIFSSATCSQTSSVYVSPLMSETKFHAYTEPKQNYRNNNVTTAKQEIRLQK
jgi:hypothetical protein